MPRGLPIRAVGAAVYAAWLCAAVFAQGGTLDRIAVTVGQHVISERDILQDIRTSSFLDDKAPDFSGDQKRKTADRLIDQYLVLEDATLTRAPLPAAADAQSLLTPIKARYASDSEYRSALAAAGITEAELSEHLLAGLRMLRYTELRFRPEVQIGDAALHAYYDKLPPGRSFEDSRSDIEKLLTDQQTMQSLDLWLSMTRSETPILYHETVFQ